MRVSRRGVTVGALALGASACWGVAAWTNGAARPALLVLNKAENTLAILNPDTLAVEAKVATGEGPHEVVTTPDGRLAIVANYGAQQPGSTLSVIDIAARKELRRVNLGSLRRPHGLVEVDGKIYFTAEVNRVVGRYDPATDQVDWVAGTGQAGTHMVAAAPDGSRLYTANIGSGTVTVMDLYGPPGQLGIDHLPVGKQPEGIAVSPDGKEVWVGRLDGGEIAILDAGTDQLKERLRPRGVPIRIYFTPDGRRVLVSDPAGAQVIVYEAATRRELKRIPVGKVPVGIAVAPDGRRAFVSLAELGQVAVLDLDALAVVKTAAVGAVPDGICWAAPRTARKAFRPGVLGVAVGPVPDAVRQAQKLDPEGGVAVQSVGPGSPAQAADLRPGDVIVSVDGVKIAGSDAFVKRVTRAAAGDKLVLETVRDGRKERKTVTLGERPAN